MRFAAKVYCSRNIFTVQTYPKTKRRKILESYLAQDNEGNDDSNVGDNVDGNVDGPDNDNDGSEVEILLT